MRWLLAAILSLLLAPEPAWAMSTNQEFTVDAWGIEEGLPQSSVKAIVQTPDGYLWVATFGGLARFDGVRFTVFDSGNLPGLPGNRLIRLSVDRSGALWLVTEQYDLARLKDGQCRVFTAADGLPPEGVACVHEDSQGVLWLAGARHGLSRWRDGRFVPVPTPPDWADAAVEDITTDARGVAWFMSHNPPCCLQNGQFVRLPAPDGQPLLELSWVAPSRDGGLWVMTATGLRKHREGAWLPEVWPCPDGAIRVMGLLEDCDGNLWLATYGNGLFCFRPAQGWQHFTVESGLTTLSLRSLFCDREGNVWVGTDGGGLLRVKPRLWGMITRRDGLGITAVHSLSQDAQGRVWFAGGTQRPYWLDHGAVSVAIPAPLSDPFQGVWAVLNARDGATWIGTYAGQAFRFQGGAVTTYEKAQGLLAGSVRALFEDRQGSLWVGGFGGLSRIDGARVTHFARRDGLSSERVWSLADDSRSCLYVGTAGGGLNCFQQGRFRVFTRGQGLPVDDISGLYVDAEDVVWIGTHGGGLSRFQAGRFFNYRVKGGLPARNVGPMLEDDAGHLWMACDLGIVRASRRELNEFAAGDRRAINFVAFDRSDGLATLEVGGIQPACLKDRDGKLWFGTSRGATFLDPKALRANPQPPPVIIDEVQIDEEVVPGLHSETGDPKGEHVRAAPEQPTSHNPPPPMVKLLPHQRRVQFHFTGLSFSAPGKVRFRYQMERFDPDWLDGGTARSASYTRLPPGHYRFRVTACNNDGVWNETGAALGVVVAPAFHQTWPFRLLALAGVAGVVAVIYQLRMARLRALARLRGRIAGDLHDEIGSNLGGIILLNELAQQTPALPPEARGPLQEINAIAQHTASALRDIVWFLNPDFDTLSDMVVRMRGCAATLLAGVDCEFVAQEFPSRRLPLDFRRNVFFAFKEILHNVAKHAAAAKVRIHLELTGSELFLRVQDNGRGFDPAAVTSGHGLRSLPRRAADLGGKFVLESTPGQGTTVLLAIPLP